MTELIKLDKLLSQRSEEKVLNLAGHMLKQEQADCPVTHRFGPNIYIREVTIAGGSFAIGHYQTTEHLNIMLSGKVIMVNEDGSKTELTAPQVFVSKPGRKVGYVVETMTWQNVYSTPETDVEKLEAMFLDKGVIWEEHLKAQTLLLSIDHSIDKHDFNDAIAELGYDADTVREMSENLADQMPFPHGSYKVIVSDSKIEGKGLFATGNIEAGELICPARLSNKRTPAGRFTNHAKKPNAIMVLRDNGDIDLMARRAIDGCRGGNLGEEITIDYRQSVRLSLRRN
jgi:hypothetical protein